MSKLKKPKPVKIPKIKSAPPAKSKTLTELEKRLAERRKKVAEEKKKKG